MSTLRSTAFWFYAFLVLTVTSLFLITNPAADLVWLFAGFLVAAGGLLLVSRVLLKSSPSASVPELLGLWISAVGLILCATFSRALLWKQALAILGGLALYVLIRFLVQDLDRAMKLRPWIAGGALLLLAANLLLAKSIGGQRNWIVIGSVSFQPSELVKVAFVFVGAATLDRLQRTRSITRYVIFSSVCVGTLFLMKDFGTALLFLLSFLWVAFLRSGDLRAIALICSAVGLCAALVLLFRPTVAERFQTYRHIWENADRNGYQQTRVLIYSSSGGLFGLGLGQGRLRGIFAASTDLIFGVLAEELGLLLALTLPLSFCFLGVFAWRRAQVASSSFYAIAAVAAAGLLLAQAALNLFGVTDLLPFTGVTLPFLSRGGTSMLSAWGLLALVTAEPRTRSMKTPIKQQ